MRTFDIMEQFRKLEEMMNEFDQETGEFIYNENELSYFVNDLNAKKELKLNNIEDLKREYKARIELIDEKIKSFQSKQKRYKNIIENFKYLQNVLLDGEKLKTDEYTFYYTNSESIIVPDKIDESLGNFTKTTIEWDKTKIKDAIKLGEDLSS
ncbi:MAG: siphovirus Gp157 family protein, partial [Candidatus Paceibacteria bacterium]